MKNALYSLVIILSFTGCQVIDVSPAPQSINVEINDQPVKLSVVDNTFNLKYNEDVTLLVPTDSLKQPLAVIFKEDFKATKLAGFDYTTLTKNGLIAHNWADTSLNNINLASKKDTIINNIATTKIKLARTFLFSKIYPTNQEAINEYNALLNQKEAISFSYRFSGLAKSTNYKTYANLVYLDDTKKFSLD